MANGSKSDDAGGSAPCFMHELPEFDAVQARDVARWRKTERERLIATRLALSAADREEHARRIGRNLDTIVADIAPSIVSLYWPFRGEPDLRPWMEQAIGRGWRVALPVVVAKAQPLQFREWTPHCRLERGVWNIPFPADGAIVEPRVVIAPLVGFDEAGYRLGYGGGFYDRTLASLSERPVAIGVGHPIGALKTIFPQWHDVPMDWIALGDDTPMRMQRPT